MPSAVSPSTQTPEGANQHEQFQDCLPCRIIGSAAFIGLGTYTFFNGRKQLREDVLKQAIEKSGSNFGLAARRATIHGIAASLVGLGLYRLMK
ncbi:hypothetical protein BDZ91DRAFT_850893 [Kalaharituber pfeilii]|nr:hypothetical protein BDZ91DRAFT_850893 [Kalaharituber pfeilii]